MLSFGTDLTRFGQPVSRVSLGGKGSGIPDYTLPPPPVVTPAKITESTASTPAPVGSKPKQRKANMGATRQRYRQSTTRERALYGSRGAQERARLPSRGSAIDGAPGYRSPTPLPRGTPSAVGPRVASTNTGSVATGPPADAARATTVPPVQVSTGNAQAIQPASTIGLGPTSIDRGDYVPGAVMAWAGTGTPPPEVQREIADYNRTGAPPTGPRYTSPTPYGNPVRKEDTLGYNRGSGAAGQPSADTGNWPTGNPMQELGTYPTGQRAAGGSEVTHLALIGRGIIDQSGIPGVVKSPYDRESTVPGSGNLPGLDAPGTEAIRKQQNRVAQGHLPDPPDQTGGSHTPVGMPTEVNGIYTGQ